LKYYLNKLLQIAGKAKVFSNLRGDLLGGITTSVIALPLAIAFGVAAFAPLGSEYVAQGALAGLYASIIAGILASIFGGTPSQITGPTAPMSVVITAVIVNLMKNPDLAAIGINPAEAILFMVAATIVLGGLFQIVLGLIGGGKLVKYIPYPVVAGFMNGIAVLIFIGQLQPFFGADKSASLISIFSGQGGFYYEVIIVGIITIIAILAAERFIRAIPSTLVGLAVGIAAYFVIGGIANPSILQLEGNPLIIGPIPRALPTPAQAFAFFRLSGDIPLSAWASIIGPACILGILAAIDTLLTSVVADVATKTKHNSNKELIGQGIGNVGSALFGGLSAAGSTAVTMVNINSGGRTALSGCVKSVTVLLIILVLGPFVQWIPMAVLAGILMVTAVRMVDYRSFSLVRKKSTLGNLIIVLAVTIITVSIDLMIAVAIGLVIACLLFVKEHISKTIIRRKYTGDSVHSKKVRPQQTMSVLEENGHQIKVYELSDSLFFGTCDKLLAEVEKDLDTRCIILDLKRVNTIDLTGTQLIRQMVDLIKDRGNHLLLAYLDIPGDRDKERLRSFMEDLGVPGIVGHDHIFPDTDHALEWAEDHIIEEVTRGSQQDSYVLELKDLSVFKDLSPAQLALVHQYTRPVSCEEGTIICKEGEPGDGIYFILSGYVSVYTGDREHRLATFAEGVYFGEMALLEDKPRSASVRAETETKLLFIAKEDFQKLTESEPTLAAHILLGIAREMSHRLRMTNAEVTALEE
jgi:SulP family sulfate permease